MSTTTPTSTVIVIPVYNEAAVISSVIHDIQQAGFPHIIVVDDGSTDHTRETAIKAGAHVIRHRINRGKGAATKTGITAATSLAAQYVVTMDGDGQHNPTEIKQLLHPLIAGEAAVALGTRLHHAGMPQHRRLSNRVANVVAWFYAGVKVSDSQCGFRAYTKPALKYINTKADRYDYETEVIRELRRHRLPYQEVPVTAVYTEYSMGKTQKQNITNGIKTLYSLIWKNLSLK